MLKFFKRFKSKKAIGVLVTAALIGAGEATDVAPVVTELACIAVECEQE